MLVETIIKPWWQWVPWKKKVGGSPTAAATVEMYVYRFLASWWYSQSLFAVCTCIARLRATRKRISALLLTWRCGKGWVHLWITMRLWRRKTKSERVSETSVREDSWKPREKGSYPFASNSLGATRTRYCWVLFSQRLVIGDMWRSRSIYDVFFERCTQKKWGNFRQNSVKLLLGKHFFRIVQRNKIQQKKWF